MSFSGSRIFHYIVIQMILVHHLTLFCLFFLAFKQAEFTLHPDFHETWVPENSLQPWALPQSEPLLHDICICSSISLSLLVLPGVCPLDRYCVNVTWSTCRKILTLLCTQILKLESATVGSGRKISHLRKRDRRRKATGVLLQNWIFRS